MRSETGGLVAVRANNASVSAMHFSACISKSMLYTMVFLMSAGALLAFSILRGPHGLCAAAYRQDVQSVKSYLEAGADPNTRDSRLFDPELTDMTALLWAVEGDSGEVVLALAAAGANLELTHTSGLSPLQWACNRSKWPAAIALVKAGADPDIQDAEGVTPLMTACWRGQADLALTLLEQRCLATKFDRNGTSALPLAWFGFRNDPEKSARVIKRLVQQGIDVNGRVGPFGRSGPTILMLACRSWASDDILWLIHQGADPRILDEEGRSAAQFLGDRPDAEAIRQVLSATRY